MDYAKILCLISSLENLWICSTVVFKKLLNGIKYNIKLRNQLLQLILMHESGRVKIKNKAKSQRKYWIRPGRSKEWWNGFIKDEVLPDEWKESFYILSDELQPYIMKNTTQMRKPIDVEKQVAVVLYYLVDEGCMRKTSKAFGIAKSTVFKIIYRVTKAIDIYLGLKLIKLPITEEEVTESCRLFFEKHGFPQCIGAIDGTDILMKRPSDNSGAYINRKGRYSLNIQAVADHNYCFIDVVIKWPGSVHDVRMFSILNLFQSLRNGAIPQCRKVINDGQPEIPICIFGDPAYPLLPYLMKEFANGVKINAKKCLGITYRL